MMFEIHDSKTIGKGHPEICVHFAPVLPMPDNREPIDKLNQMAVIVARYGKNGWSYIAPDGNTKEQIGDAMQGHGCKILKWYWLTEVQTELKK